MKYSLRSLMIVVTLACVVLGGVMARVEYLRRQAVFHDAQQARHLAQWRKSFERTNLADLEAHERELYFHHRLLAKEYRKAAYRPWVIVTETPEPAP